MQHVSVIQTTLLLQSVPLVWWWVREKGELVEEHISEWIAVSPLTYLLSS